MKIKSFQRRYALDSGIQAVNLARFSMRILSDYILIPPSDNERFDTLTFLYDNTTVVLAQQTLEKRQ